MTIPFYKYQGTGNDFVMIDHREPFINHQDTALIEKLCDRRLGIGADGLILLENHPDFDFRMVYFNADGRESTMCGNGGRCITAFANYLGLIDKATTFLAIDGPHDAEIQENWVKLKMQDVIQIEAQNNFLVLNTGSPHYIKFVPNVSAINVKEAGSAIRYSDRFKAEGINVNFVEQGANELSMATYERGVEDETLSCGTGVTAAAIAHQYVNQHHGATEIPVATKGGNLSVKLEQTKTGFQNIWLCGPTELVFEGKISM